MRRRILGEEILTGGLHPLATRSLCLLLLLALSSFTAFSQFPGVSPSASNLDARVVLSSGRVSVSRSGQMWVLNVGDAVRPEQEIVTGEDGYAVLQLTDGSSFEVYPNSRVLFRSNRGNWSDVLDVWVGRLKIHIERFMGKPNPHRIHTPTAVISVRGTTLFVEVEEDSEATRVSVDEGEVMVEHRLLPSGKTRVLRDGEELHVSKDEPIARSVVDKGGMLRAAFRALSDALYTIAVESQRTGAGIPGGGGGTPLPGDDGPKTPPPPAPGGGGSSAPTTTAPPPPPPPPGL